MLGESQLGEEKSLKNTLPFANVLFLNKVLCFRKLKLYLKTTTTKTEDGEGRDRQANSRIVKYLLSSRWEKTAAGTWESRLARSHLFLITYPSKDGMPLPWEHTVAAPKTHMLKGEPYLEEFNLISYANARKLLGWYLLAQVLLSPSCYVPLQVSVMAGTPQWALPASVPRGINCRIEARCGADERDLEKHWRPDSIR